MRKNDGDGPRKRPALYIDVDHTIMARNFPEGFLELRPGVMGQLRILSRLFDCRWLTCWPWDDGAGMDVRSLLRALYSDDLVPKIGYCTWKRGHPDGKAGTVLAPGAPTDFWWLEDPLGRNERRALERAGRLDRYVEVSPSGPWGFADACLDLFERVGIRDDDLAAPGGSLRMFRKESYFSPTMFPA